MHRRNRFTVALGIVALALAAGQSTAPQAQTQKLQTPAEAVNYGQGGTLYDR